MMIYVLEEIFKSTKNDNSERFNLRVQRSLSWLKKAVMMEDDKDLQFLSLWVAFNAIHAEDADNKTQKQKQIGQFLALIPSLDLAQSLSTIVWNKLAEPIQKVLDTPYTYQMFWDYRNQAIDQSTWRQHFENEKNRVDQLLQDKDLKGVLYTLLSRMFTVENQILQGGASYNSSLNRSLVNDCCQILIALIPVILELLINNSQQWRFDKPHYPVVQVC